MRAYVNFHEKKQSKSTMIAQCRCELNIAYAQTIKLHPQSTNTLTACATDIFYFIQLYLNAVAFFSLFSLVFSVFMYLFYFFIEFVSLPDLVSVKTDVLAPVLFSVKHNTFFHINNEYTKIQLVLFFYFLLNFDAQNVLMPILIFARMIIHI